MERLEVEGEKKKGENSIRERDATENAKGRLGRVETVVEVAEKMERWNGGK